MLPIFTYINLQIYFKIDSVLNKEINYKITFAESIVCKFCKAIWQFSEISGIFSPIKLINI